MISKDEALDIVHICEIAAKSPIERVKMNRWHRDSRKRYIAWMPKPGPYRPKEGENV